MPLFYQQDINETTRLGIWEIQETEGFFLDKVPLQKNITHPHKRLQHLAGRYLLPFLFSDFPHHEIEIADTRKPFLRGEEYHFSISHCGNYAAAIVSNAERVGIDIEMISDRLHRIKHKFLHPDELAFVETHDEMIQTQLLTTLWSAKEAMFKWWGNGDVEFSEVLRLNEFTFGGRGVFSACFKKEELAIPLEIHYELRNDISLAWIAGG